MTILLEMPERQTRPRGVNMEIDKTWKADVAAKLEKLGMTQAALAMACGVTASAISVMLRPETKQTRIKPAVHRALGWDAPVRQAPTVDRDAAFLRLLENWKDLSEDERNHVVTTAEMLRRAHKPPVR